MVVYVSPAELNGGILQFSVSLARETRALTDCRLFLPSIVDESLYADIADCVVPYTKAKTLNGSSGEILGTAKQIMSCAPDVVVFTEDSILMQQINTILNKNAIRTAMVVHDVRHHPYRKMSIRSIAVDVLRRQMTRSTIKHTCKVILLSANSEEAFQKEYRAANTVVFRLPAHVPKAVPEKPPEIKSDAGDYLLFFGRIDKYKGIDTLCKAYGALPEDVKKKAGLVIAGKGEFSAEERDLIRSDSYIMPISRFITDNEMVWLFQNARAVVLPYTEASQSGVLPIAYRFGKPVVVSNLPGLTENVIDNGTGCVFKTTEELSEILCRLSGDRFSMPETAIFEYYQENFSWKSNLEVLLKLLCAETEMNET